MSKSKKKSNRTTIPALLVDMTEQMKNDVDTFMFDYGFMFRYAFTRYIKIEQYFFEPKEIQKQIQELEKELSLRTGYPIRVAKDVVYDAIQLVNARHALMKEYLANWEERYNNTIKKYEKLTSIPTISPKSLRMIGLQNKMERQKKKIAFYQQHITNNTFPSVIFGGRKNFEKRQKGELSKEEWNEFRNGRVSSRGDETKGGNPNLRVVETDEGFMLQMTSNRKIEQGKRFVYEKTLIPLYIATKRCKKTGQLKGRKYPEMMKRTLEKGSAYEVEILKRNGNYYVHIVVKNEQPPIKSEVDGVLAVDTNIDGLALCRLTNEGKPIGFKWVGDGGLQYYPSNKRENKIWELANKVVYECLVDNLVLAVEDIDQMHNHEMHKRMRRRIGQFCYKKLLECMETLCVRYGVKFIKVKPQYTSVIGRLKYQTKYRVNVHLSAAMVIGRRALHFEEKVPSNIVSLLTAKQKEKFEEQNEWKQWSVVKTRITNLLKKRKAKFYQWSEHKKDVYQTNNKPKNRKKATRVAL